MDGTQYVARAYDGVVAVAESPAVTLRVSGRSPLEFATGHLDLFDMHFDGDQMDIDIRRRVPSAGFQFGQLVYREPEDTSFRVLPEAAQEVPDGAENAFLGEPGDTVHILPATQDPDLLCPGVGSLRLGFGTLADNEVTLSVIDVEGPGHFKMLDGPDPDSDRVQVDSADGLPDAYPLPTGVRIHQGWASLLPARIR